MARRGCGAAAAGGGREARTILAGEGLRAAPPAGQGALAVQQPGSKGTYSRYRRYCNILHHTLGQYDSYIKIILLFLGPASATP